MLSDLVPNAVHGLGDLVVRMARNVLVKCSRIHVATRAPLSLGQPLRTLEDVVGNGYGSFHTRSITGAGHMRSAARSLSSCRFDRSAAASRPSAGNRLQGFHADGHDVGVMVLLVANRGSEAPQQPKRDLPFDLIRGVPLAKRRGPILKALRDYQGNEFEHRAATLLKRHQKQTPPLGFLSGFILPEQRRQCLLTGRAPWRPPRARRQQTKCPKSIVVAVMMSGNDDALGESSGCRRFWPFSGTDRGAPCFADPSTDLETLNGTCGPSAACRPSIRSLCWRDERGTPSCPLAHSRPPSATCRENDEEVDDGP